MKNISRILTLALALLFALLAQARPVDQIPNVHLADSTRYVSDPDGYLSPEAIRQADVIIGNIWRNTTAEVIAVFVKDLSGKDIDRYAIELTDKWKVGKADKDNGLLLLVSIDDRKAGIYTGYGMEGVMPDIKAANIRRDVLNPQLKAGNYDAALLNTLNAISQIVNDPAAVEELRSGIPNNSGAKKGEMSEFFSIYITFGIIAAVVMLIWLFIVYSKTRTLDRHTRFERLSNLNAAFLTATVGFIGIPILAFLLLKLMQKHVRRSVPKCPNCAQKMRLVDEVHDNDYLTPAQDSEEQLNSVDYDVWLCDNCGDTEIIPYVNHSSLYTECPRCHARADQLRSNEVVRKPTTSSEGIGEKTYVCRHCGNTHKTAYKIAKLVAPTPILFMGGGGGGHRGGGFGGGSFGGGSFGGGGSSGSW